MTDSLLLKPTKSTEAQCQINWAWARLGREGRISERKGRWVHTCVKKDWERTRKREMPVSTGVAFGWRYVRPFRRLLSTKLLSHLHLHLHHRLSLHSAISANLSSPLFPNPNFITGNSLFSRMEVTFLSLPLPCLWFYWILLWASINLISSIG